MKSFLISTEIVGTKEYRKPEWVTHMEEMREALKGNLLFSGIICIVLNLQHLNQLTNSE